MVGVASNSIGRFAQSDNNRQTWLVRKYVIDLVSSEPRQRAQRVAQWYEEVTVMSPDNSDWPDHPKPSGQTIDVERRATLPCAEETRDHPRLVVFDFDNTIYAGDSGTELVTWLLSQNWWRVIAASLISPAIAPLWLCAHTRRRAISTYLWIGTVGVPGVDMSTNIDRYVATELGRLRTRLRPQGMDALAAHRDAGDQVVVVTGAPWELVRTVLGSDASDPIRVVGSTSRRFMGGLILDRHCYAVQKLAMLYDAGHTAPIVIAYSDSTIDLPILTHAGKPILVNPRASHIAVFRRTLGAEIEIRNWDPVATGERAPMERMPMSLFGHLMPRFSHWILWPRRRFR